MASPEPLPPGQREHGSFPRFGLTPYAPRFPREPRRIQLSLTGELQTPLDLDDAAWARLPPPQNPRCPHTSWQKCSAWHGRSAT